MMKTIFCLAIFVFLAVSTSWSQSQMSMDSTSMISNSSKVKTAAVKVNKSLKSEENDAQLALYYENLAFELLRSGDTLKAEDYYSKSVKMYKKAKNNQKVAELTRELAKIQEKQKQYDKAIHTYEMASSNSINTIEQEMNQSDANRLRSNNSPVSQMELLEEKIQLIENNPIIPAKEKTQAYIQMAEVNNEMKKPELAIMNYQKALENPTNTNEEVRLIKNKISIIYLLDNQIEKAISIQKEIIRKSEETGDIESTILQMQELSSIYFKAGNSKEGFFCLKDAYQRALQHGKLKQAKTTLQMLVEKYESIQNNSEIVLLYKSFIQNLDTLIKSDSSIVDIKVFQITEEKIQQLEKERELKNELLDRKNNFNYMLIASVLLLLVFMGLITKALFSIKKRNKKIALQSLRREMNPHFIFNSLNSVNQFIASNNELEANKFLSSYSNLMRNFMENSNKDFVSLNSEIEQLKKYLELEKSRFADKFDYKIEVDENLDFEGIQVPNMIIQPNLENAIWHGLRYKESKGILILKFVKEENSVLVIIDDNGIGLKASKEMKTKNQKLHDSLGLENVMERIKLLNEIYKTKIRFEISEKVGQESGVVVKIEW